MASSRNINFYSLLLGVRGWVNTQFWGEKEAGSREEAVQALEEEDGVWSSGGGGQSFFSAPLPG